MKQVEVKPVKAWAFVNDRNEFGGLIANSEKALWTRMKRATGVSVAGLVRSGGKAIRVEIKPIDSRKPRR